ncbi:alpha/beta hydrolase [Flavobacterium cyanobacteriorum]|uniref:Alpha/beta hydrolase n=1 Tax=Flavobacterium cyanobacteriorum TaxID=2022802 RepID=A0A255ZBV1_9FLAO|nr:alpha/beta hydrolase [Flavobacterium cyanobacteriorum]OYQ38355.1 alpha/beta hydrolase [Flavobacterium cyanobacteriorum]
MQKLLTNIVKRAVGFYINAVSHVYPATAAKLAYKFFSEPREGKLAKDRLPDVLQSADAEILTHGEFIFQMYTWKGNDTKILLVHGWESNTSRWEQLLTYLKKSGSTIIAIDAPAHGLSSGTEFNIPRYAEFIHVIIGRHKPQVLIGHSLGGATALYYQSHYPNDVVEKMVILGAPCDLDTILNNYKNMLGLNNKVFSLLQNHFLKHFRISTKDFSGSLFASKIKAKGLLAHDIDDDVVAFTEGKKIAGAWPDAEFVVTKGLGHSLHDDKLYKKIYSFIFGKEAAL